jgi:hypothetical protein
VGPNPTLSAISNYNKINNLPRSRLACLSVPPFLPDVRRPWVSDVKTEGKGNARYRSRCQNLSDRIGKLQSDWFAVAVDAGVVVKLGQRQDVSKHNPHVCSATADVDQQTLRYFTPGIRPQPWDESLRPEERRPLITLIPKRL